MQFFSKEYPEKNPMNKTSPTSVKDPVETKIVNNLSFYPSCTPINIRTSNPINLALIYWDLIIVLSRYVAKYNKSSIYTNSKELLELLDKNGHLVGIINIINNKVDNAQQIIETTLKTAVKNNQSEITQILLTLHKSQISDESIQENLRLAKESASQDIYDMLENIVHERDRMKDTPGFSYTGNCLS